MACFLLGSCVTRSLRIFKARNVLYVTFLAKFSFTFLQWWLWVSGPISVTIAPADIMLSPCRSWWISSNFCSCFILKSCCLEMPLVILLGFFWVLSQDWAWYRTYRLVNLTWTVVDFVYSAKSIVFWVFDWLNFLMNIKAFSLIQYLLTITVSFLSLNCHLALLLCWKRNLCGF